MSQPPLLTFNCNRDIFLANGAFAVSALSVA